MNCPECSKRLRAMGDGQYGRKIFGCKSCNSIYEIPPKTSSDELRWNKNSYNKRFSYGQWDNELKRKESDPRYEVCPACSTKLIFLQEGRPLTDTRSTRRSWTHLFACEKCLVVFPFSESPPRNRAHKDPLDDLFYRLNKINWCYIRDRKRFTLPEYLAAKARQSTSIFIEDTSITQPGLGTEIYVASDSALIGGLAIVEAITYVGPGLLRKNRSGFRIFTEEHNRQTYYWEDLAPMQEKLSKEFGSSRASIVITDYTIPKTGQKVYVDTVHYESDYFYNADSEGYCKFYDLPEDALIPRIKYLHGGLAEVIRVFPKVQEDSQVSYRLELKIGYNSRQWYKWDEIREKQETLKIKFGDKESGFCEGINFKDNAEYEKKCLELFGFVPKFR